ncbi:unnamed protein product [Adineta ricciae]|uniref:Uncharacterized protein n=1 Tax=Adineta ricciae TaxID=249248 RepID=A0A816BWR2_ADIRI|nr:unnamed protein product [Adineta ricciae]
MCDVTGAGLHKELATGNKFLLMHEADANLTKLGFYHFGQAGAVSNRSLMCEAFDGFSDSSKTTGMYDFSIEDSRLSLLGACTGGAFHLLLARYSVHKISDGCENRFLYHFVENNLIPYDLIRKSDRFLPSLQQIFVVIHLMGRIMYTFVDSLGNDEPQRFYVTKGKYYIAEGQRLFKDRQKSHLQSFYSKSAEIFPRLCVNMQRFLDAMLILFEMRRNEDLQFAQVVDEKFVGKAKSYIEKHLVLSKHANGDVVSFVSLETCLITEYLFDNYLFKNTLNLFNLEHSANQPSMPSTQFRTLLAEKPSIEKRILQLPYQFFLRSDLKQPTTNENGKRINAPLHHVDGNSLNTALDRLVNQKLLSMGHFISRPRAQQTHSYMKNPIPNDSLKKEEFHQYLQEYKINADEYHNLLTRSNVPNNCTLLPEAKNLLTTRIEHHADCVKYGLESTVTLINEVTFRGLIQSNLRNIPQTTNRSLFIETSAIMTTENESHENDEFFGIDDRGAALVDRNNKVMPRISEEEVVLNNNYDLNHVSRGTQEFSANDFDEVQANQTEVAELIEKHDKTSDVQPKVETTLSNNYPPIVKACVKAILQYPSIVLSSSDISLATRHHTAVARQTSLRLMIDKELLQEGDYFVRKLAKSVKITRGFAKKVPRLNDEQSRFEFIAVLNEFGITWDLFKSFFDLSKEGFYTTTQLLLNETAEAMLDSEDYRSYVNYDKRAVFRPIDNAVTEQDELEYGDNVTGIEPFETATQECRKRKKTQATSQSKRKNN